MKTKTRWRFFVGETARIYKVSDDVSLDDVAGMLFAQEEGAIDFSNAMNDLAARAHQIMMYRSYLKLLFRQPS